MRRLGLAALTTILIALPVLGAEKQLVVTDTPTQLGSIFLLQGQVAAYDPDLQNYTLDQTLVIPGNPKIDAIHKMDSPGEFLFSISAGCPNSDPLGTAVGSSVTHNDVVRFDGESSYSLFFCNNSLPDPSDVLPPGCNIDAVYLDGGDDGDLILSIDAAAVETNGVDFAIGTVEQTDLIRYARTGPGCADWDLIGFVFDGSALDPGGNPLIPGNYNVVGATRDEDNLFLALDVPAFLGASAYNPYDSHQGQIATWSLGAGTFSLTAAFAGWYTPPFSAAFANSLASPPPSCTGLNNPNQLDQIVDLCSATWSTDTAARRFRVEWLPVSGAESYKVYRGLSADLECPAGLAMTMTPTLNTFFVELDDPPLGDSFFYLIQAVFPGPVDGPLAPGCSPGCGGGCCARVLVGTCP